MPQSDRRQGRISVQELRRDLREADEDRFRLTSALTPRRASGGGIMGVLFLLIAGFISALWTSRGPAPAAGLLSAATPAMVAPAVVAHSGTVVEGPVAKPPRQIRHSTVVETAAAKKPSRRIRHSTNNSRGQLAHVRRVERPSPRVSRPLHPGEFGRLPSSDRRTGAQTVQNR